MQQSLSIALLSQLCALTLAQNATVVEDDEQSVATRPPDGRFSTLEDGYVILIAACYVCVACILPSLFFAWKTHKQNRADEERERNAQPRASTSGAAGARKKSDTNYKRVELDEEDESDEVVTRDKQVPLIEAGEMGAASSSESEMSAVTETVNETSEGDSYTESSE